MDESRIQIAILVPHASRPAVLTTPEGTLPITTSPTSSTVEQLDAVTARLGTLPPVLRIVLGVGEGPEDAIPRLVVLEGIDASPTGFIWTDVTALDITTGAPHALQGVVSRAIARHREGPGERDVPWSRPGWYGRATTWMTDQMADLGHPATSQPRIVYLWGISMVLRAESAAGSMFLKCSAPAFRQEAAVTAVLAEVTPRLVTRVAAVEPQEGWLLMFDHGDTVLGERPQNAWIAGLDLLPSVQRAWTDRNGELAQAGAPVRSIVDLAELAPTFASRATLASQLSADDRRAWDAAIPDLVAACRRLDALGPPPTLVHGDFHPWNVADDPAGPRIFDWTDAAISHPFTDLAVYATRADDVAVRRAMRDAYLAHWSDRMEPAALTEAGELAIVVGTLYQVDSYMRLVETLDPDDLWDLAPAVGSWARATVATLSEGIALVRPGHADG